MEGGKGMELFFNLTLNGLATGMLIFLLAAGLTLIFGLMDVLNFAHGGLFAWGAYSGTWIYASTGSFYRNYGGSCDWDAAWMDHREMDDQTSLWKSRATNSYYSRTNACTI